jgi:hypothetical protein
LVKSGKTSFVVLLLAFILLPWVPVVVWAFFGEWGPVLLGLDRYEDFMATRLYPIILGVFVAIPIVASITSYVIYSFVGGTGSKKRILRTGRPARAILRSISESSTGFTININGQPYLNLVLEIIDADLVPYEVSMDTIVPRTVLPQLIPGTELAVKVDPEDSKKVVVVWE